MNKRWDIPAILWLLMFDAATGQFMYEIKTATLFHLWATQGRVGCM